MLHTLRQIVDNDEKWRSVLRGLNKDFYHQTVTGKQVEDYISAELGLDLKLFFDQYLRNTTIPTFEYGLVDGDMRYRWANCIQGFTIPVKVWINGEPRVLVPGKRWTSLDLEESIEKVEVDKDYYVATMKITDS